MSDNWHDGGIVFPKVEFALAEDVLEMAKLIEAMTATINNLSQSIATINTAINLLDTAQGMVQDRAMMNGLHVEVLNSRVVALEEHLGFFDD